MHMADPLIDVSGLAKSYGGRSVVSGVTMLLKAGDIIGLVGANGGGKTTTLRMIAGLHRADSGQGTVFGESIRNPKRDSRHLIGYMSQRLSLYPDLTVLENLEFRAAVHGIAKPAERIERMSEQYGIADILKQRFDTLSGGWARRAQFAATLLHAPPLLLLDEPTAGLDPATRQDIWGWLQHLAGQGHAIVLATHDLVEAERLPQILLYHQGCASAAMSPADLMQLTACASLEQAVIARARSLQT